MKSSIICAVSLVLFFIGSVAFSQSIVVAPLPNLPPYLLVVDKEHQKIYLLSYKDHKLSIALKNICSTGNQKGDKFLEGDMKTPEGVYFITHRIKGDLNYTLYGGMAYGLNYPNPVDRIFGKKGHGIWLHGRGKKLLPRDTKGCVAVHTSFLETLSEFIDEEFTPLLIGERIKIIKKIPSSLEKENKTLIEKIRQWKKMWEEKKEDFFSFYNPMLFSKASGCPFSNFISQKLTYFHRYKWIDIFIPKIYLVKGPYYWVSFFYQYFRSPTFKSEGIKRLYWMKINNTWQIVGSEWSEKHIGLEKLYMEAARKKIKKFIQMWQKAWQKANIKTYASFYNKDVIQNNLRGLKKVLDHKIHIWATSPPLKIKFSDIQIKMVKRGFKVTFNQEYWSKKYHDRGKKILLLIPWRDSYKIVEEKWSAR